MSQLPNETPMTLVPDRNPKVPDISGEAALIDEILKLEKIARLAGGPTPNPEGTK